MYSAKWHSFAAIQDYQNNIIYTTAYHMRNALRPPCGLFGGIVTKTQNTGMMNSVCVVVVVAVVAAVLFDNCQVMSGVDNVSCSRSCIDHGT